MEEYLDRYEGVKSEILNTTRFNENLSMTYLGKLSMTRNNNVAVDKRFSITIARVYSRQGIRWY